MNRRDFLQGTLGLLALQSPLFPGSARAIGDGQRFQIVRAMYPGHWNVHPGSLDILSRECGLRTSIDVNPEARALDIGSTEFLRHPMAVLLGDRAFELTPNQRRQLKRWLEMGGFLLIDNNGRHRPDPGFERSVRREFKHMFPARPLSRLSPEHVIFRSFYRLDYPAGRAIHKPYVDGLILGDRVAVVFSHNDLLGAFAPAGAGAYRLTPRPGGDSQREFAFRFGVNLALYSLCLHYKDDQVHLDYLLHRRKWKVKRPQ